MKLKKEIEIFTRVCPSWCCKKEVLHIVWPTKNHMSQVQNKIICTSCFKWSWERLENLNDLMMPFGKHKGKFLKEISRDYLKWMSENATNLNDRYKLAIENILEENTFGQAVEERPEYVGQI